MYHPGQQYLCPVFNRDSSGISLNAYSNLGSILMNCENFSCGTLSVFIT